MVYDFITNLKPNLIINCAAYTAVDKAEKNLELADRINGDGPTNLAKAAKAVGSKLVHISTDYVFGGDLDLSKAYKEDDEKKPVTAYGITKKTKFIQEIYIVGTNYFNFFRKSRN